MSTALVDSVLLLGMSWAWGFPMLSPLSLPSTGVWDATLPGKLHLQGGKAIQLRFGQERVDMNKEIWAKDDTCLRGYLEEVGMCPKQCQVLSNQGLLPSWAILCLQPLGLVAAGGRRACWRKSNRICKVWNWGSFSIASHSALGLWMCEVFVKRKTSISE